MTRSQFLSMDRKLSNKLIADKTLNNVYVVRKTLELCAKNNWNYRISSGMMPLETLPDIGFKIEDCYNFSKIQHEFDLSTKLIQTHNIRCSTHPDQFVVPASPKQDVAQKSAYELSIIGKMMDMFGLRQDYYNPINIHMNCFKNMDLNDTSNRFVDVFNSLPTSVKSRLVLEVEDKPNSWGVDDLYKYIFEKTGIPITYDSHHFRLNNPKQMTPNEAIKKCISTWKNHVPLFHYSNGKSGESDRSHSDYVNVLHEELFDDTQDINVEFEFKMKDLAIQQFTDTMFPF